MEYMSLRFRFPLIFTFFVVSAFGQNSKLADQYYLEGEYQKAGDLYLKLHETAKKNNNFTYFNKYIECLLAVRNYEVAENQIRDQMRAQPADFSMLVTLGNVQERMGHYEDAQVS